MITIRGQILVSRTDDDPLLFVCGFKTSPCVPAPRAHVETHVRVVPVQGDVLNAHTEGVLYTHTVFFTSHFFFHVFSACRNTDKHAHTQTQHHNTQHHTETETERDRDRQRKREGEKERRREREREKERRERQEKRQDEEERRRKTREETR